jgi:hypothetical protein
VEVNRKIICKGRRDPEMFTNWVRCSAGLPQVSLRALPKRHPPIRIVILRPRVLCGSKDL